MMDILRDHWAFRQQICKLAQTDLVKTYRGAALGWAWAVIKPAITIFVFWFAFTFGLRSGAPVHGYPYALWLIVGLVPWFYLGEMLSAGTDAIRSYPYLVNKMRFPVSTISTFVSLSKYYIHLLLLGLTVVIYFIAGGTLDVYFLQLPLYMALLFLFATVWSLFSAPLSAISKDFSSLVKSMVQPAFWLSGVIWDPDTVDVPALQVFLDINPITFLTRGYRAVFITKQWLWEDPLPLIAFAIVMVVLIAVAVRTHTRLRKEIPDVI